MRAAVVRSIETNCMPTYPTSSSLPATIAVARDAGSWTFDRATSVQPTSGVHFVRT